MQPSVPLSFALACIFLSLTAISHSGENIPNDVRYMLEDIYGTDRSKWPGEIYSQDINADGVADWLARQPGCNASNNCMVEVFLCAKSEGTKCTEYCYTGSNKLADIEKNIDSMKCQSTC